MTAVRIIHVGDFKEKFYADAAAEYTKRLGAFCTLRDVTVREERTDDKKASDALIERALEAEGARIREAAGKCKCVALCVEGKQISSEELAALLEKMQYDGEIAFIVGSSRGIAADLKAQCAQRISMSAMTFPHELARVMLLEQLYRAFTILGGKKYHK